MHVQIISWSHASCVIGQRPIKSARTSPGSQLRMRRNSPFEWGLGRD